MNDYQVLPVGGELIYTPDFSADVPAGSAVTAIAFTVEPAGSLALAGQSNDYAEGQASIRVSGSAHGGRYTLKATATLDNGEVIPKFIAIVGVNG
jgi:hypothetical protein